MKLYANLSGISFLKNHYVLKFLFIAFIGIHIPLIGLLFCVLYFDTITTTHLVIFTLAFTLLSSAITLFILKQLMDPIAITSKALLNYKNTHKIPKLPTKYTDEIGVLMHNIQETIETTEKLLIDRKELINLLLDDIKTASKNSIALANAILIEKTPETSIKYVNEIKDSAINQEEFIENFVHLLHQEDEILSKTVKVSKIDFETLLANLQKQFQGQLRDKNLILKINSKYKELLVRTNESLLVTVLEHLLENAIKFSYPNNEINIYLNKEKAKLSLSVVDNGIGFDVSNSERLFDKFTKIRQLGTKGEKSTGIGLYLCKQIMSKSNGSLSAESDGLNKGAVFEIQLKVYK